MTMQEPRVERCGFCGRFFRGIEFLDDKEIEALPDDVFDYATESLGYCPEANAECEEQEDRNVDLYYNVY